VDERASYLSDKATTSDGKVPELELKKFKKQFQNWNRFQKNLGTF